MLKKEEKFESVYISFISPIASPGKALGWEVKNQEEESRSSSKNMQEEYGSIIKAVLCENKMLKKKLSMLRGEFLNTYNTRLDLCRPILEELIEPGCEDHFDFMNLKKKDNDKF